MIRGFLFTGALCAILVATPLVEAKPGHVSKKPATVASLSPARQYEQQINVISKDWIRAAEQFYNLYFQFSPTMPANEKKVLIPKILAAMPEVRKQGRRYGSISPVPVSMRSVDAKYVQMSRAMDEQLDAIKQFVYSGSLNDQEKIQQKFHEVADLMESATKEKRRILETTSSPKKYVPG